MNDHKAFLAELNRLIPPDVDWKKGAEEYVQNCFLQQGQAEIEKYSFSKPMREVTEDPSIAITDTVHYLNNFTNALALLQPPRGSRILDVACGGGWVSNYLSKMGYWTYGIDISSQFIDLARRRLASDASLHLNEQSALERFAVLDIEETPLPAHLENTFDIVWLESCLHHFVDPVKAMRHLARALKPDGVVVLIEFENRKGGIKPDYLKVMEEFHTLERPYSRSELLTVLNLSGFADHEFVGTINGWFAPGSARAKNMATDFISGADEMNLAICAKNRGVLDRYFDERTIGPIRYGTGFFPEANGYRWCAPYAELDILQPLRALSISVNSQLAATRGDTQTVVFYDKEKELARVQLSSTSPQQVVNIGAIEPRRISMCSADAFRPSWKGEADDRLLSYYVNVSYD